MDVADTLTFLLGTWKLERSIEDHRSGEHGWFFGTATLETWPSGCGGCVSRGRYEEVGELRFGGYAGVATRRLEYRRLEGGAVTVHFEDGRPFVDLDLRPGRWCGFHECGKDRYELTTVVRSSAVLEETWRVRGPRKHYDAVTTLARVS